MALFNDGYSRNRIEQAVMKSELELMPVRSARVCVLALIMLISVALPAQTTREQGHLSHRQAVTRARQLVARMTLDEKIAQVHGIKDATHFRFVSGVPRLGIPELRVTNGPAGVGPGGAGSQKPATAWPAPIALAASWDTELARTYGRLAADEARSLGSNLLESPDINIARIQQRSEERRVGKECRSRGSPDHSSRRRHTRCLSDWSSDVCSSDLDVWQPMKRDRLAAICLNLPISTSRAYSREAACSRAMVKIPILRPVLPSPTSRASKAPG